MGKRTLDLVGGSSSNHPPAWRSAASADDCVLSGDDAYPLPASPPPSAAGANAGEASASPSSGE